MYKGIIILLSNTLTVFVLKRGCDVEFNITVVNVIFELSMYIVIKDVVSMLY